MQNRIDETGRSHQLLDDLPGVRGLVVGGRGGNKNGLAHHGLEFVEAQRTIVHGRRQTKTIVDQIFLARAIALVHAADLRHRDVTLVDHHQRILRQIIDQRRRRLAGFATAHVARIIFDAFAETDFVEHLQIERGALLNALRFEQFVFARKIFDALAQLHLDAFERVQHRAARRHVMALRIDGKARQRLDVVAGQRIEQRQRVDLVVEHRNAQRRLGTLCRINIDRIAAHAKRAALEIDFGARVLHRDQLPNHFLRCHLVAGANQHAHRVVVGRIADAVDARHGGDDDRVLPLQQRLGRREPHLLDVFVDRGIFFDEQIARRHVRFGLIVVVVGNEIFHRVLGEKFLHFRVQLRGQRFIRCHHQRRAAKLCDHVRHRVGLARAGHAQQGLEGEAVVDAFDQLDDRLRLIACRWKWLVEFVGGIGEGDDRHGVAIRFDCSARQHGGQSKILAVQPWAALVYLRMETREV